MARRVATARISFALLPRWRARAAQRELYAPGDAVSLSSPPRHQARFMPLARICYASLYASLRFLFSAPLRDFCGTEGHQPEGRCDAHAAANAAASAAALSSSM